MNTVSIIVPVYNVEKYLYKCLRSLQAQTYKQIEIILVNDGSTDNSPNIAREFCQNDMRFRLINRPNGGLSAARNTGLANISGTYVVFVDSDDWVSPQLIESLLNNIQACQSDFACCRLEYCNIEKGKNHIYGKPFKLLYIKGRDILLDSLLVRNIPTPVWAKIYRTSFLKKNGLYFKEGIVNEDTLFTSLASMYADKVSFINQVLYYSLERPGSISRSSYNRLFSDMDIALKEVKIHMEERGIFRDEVESYYYARYLKSILYNLLQAAQRLPYKEYSESYLWCMSHTHYMAYKQWIRYLPVNHQVMYWLSRFRIGLYIGVKILNVGGFRMH